MSARVRSGRGRNLRRLALLIGIVAVVSGVGSATATTQTRFYGASVSPAAGVAAAARVTYTLTLKNEANSTQPVGSANFWAPSGWTVNAVPAGPVTSPDGHSWNITKLPGSTAPNGTSADVVMFRAATNGDVLAPGQTVSANVDATSTCTAGTANWQTETKPATDFSSAPGDDFQPAPGDVNTAVTVGSAALGSFAFDPIGTQKTGVAFTVTVTAFDTCGNKKTDYGGGATLSGNLTGVGAYPPLTFQPNTGVATASVTPHSAQFSAKLHVQDGLVAADSNAFTVADQTATCTSSAPCVLSNGTTTVGSPTPSGSQTLAVGLLSGNAVGGSFTGCTPDGPLPGESVVTVDPSGYSSAFTITLTYSKSIAPGRGVANFIVCKSSDNGVTWKHLDLCKTNHPSPPCILSRNRTGVGDLVETLLVLPNDPAWGTS